MRLNFSTPRGEDGEALPGFDDKLRSLKEAFPDPDERLRPFFEAVLYNAALKSAELTSLLRFHHKLSAERRAVVRSLLSVVWPRGEDHGALPTADARALKAARKQLSARVEAIRTCVKKCDLTPKQVRQIATLQRALRQDICGVLQIVTVRPRILRGLWKSPRPIYAWVGPAALAFAVMVLLVRLLPQISAVALLSVVMAIIVAGLYFVSMRLAIAPGVLRSAKVRRHLSAVLSGQPAAGAIQERLISLGIDFEAFAGGRTYEDKEQGVRVVVQDKRTLVGAVRFLTSSEEIANCIALRSFVSWTLPAYLADESIQLADVYYKGSQKKHAHRAQIWMVAAEEAGEPVLAVNSFEFNDPGAMHLEVLMEHSVRVLQDVATRAGFRRVYAGISDYGRAYLDRSFEQAAPSATVLKVHAPEAGYRYHFDVFQQRWSFDGARLRRGYAYAARRTLATRAYALIFGLVELAKGNRAKAAAFRDTVTNTHNMWRIPLPGD